MSALTLDVESRIDALPELRRSVAAWLRPQDVGEGELGTVQVVVSELVANAIEACTPDQPIEVVVDLSAQAISVVVRNPSRRTEPVPIPTMADPLAPRGRGLAIVGSLAQHLDLAEVDGQTVARATLLRT